MLVPLSEVRNHIQFRAVIEEQVTDPAGRAVGLIIPPRRDPWFKSNPRNQFLKIEGRVQTPGMFYFQTIGAWRVRWPSDKTKAAPLLSKIGNTRKLKPISKAGGPGIGDVE